MRLNLSVNACEINAAAVTRVLTLDASKSAARNSSPSRSDKYFADEHESLTHTVTHLLCHSLCFKANYLNRELDCVIGFYFCF